MSSLNSCVSFSYFNYLDSKLLVGAILSFHASSSIVCNRDNKTPIKGGENIYWYCYCLCSLCSMNIRAVSFYFIMLGLKRCINLYMATAPGMRHQFELPKFSLLLKIATRIWLKTCSFHLVALYLDDATSWQCFWF